MVLSSAYFSLLSVSSGWLVCYEHRNLSYIHLCRNLSYDYLVSDICRRVCSCVSPVLVCWLLNVLVTFESVE